MRYSSTNLYLIGIVGKELEWFRLYFVDMSQHVDYKGPLSDMQDINIGIPQGSYWGHSC